MKNNKKRIIYIAVVVAVLLVSISTFTYALWGASFTQTTTNNVTAGCFNVEFSESSTNNQISLVNTYPISDNAGMSTDAYTFTVSNKCTVASNFETVLNILTTNGTPISNNYVKAYVEEVNSSSVVVSTPLNPTLVSALSDSTNIDTSTSTAAKILFNGYLAPATSTNGTDGGKKTYKLRLWIDSTAANDVANMVFNAKVTVVAAASTTQN